MELKTLTIELKCCGKPFQKIMVPLLRPGRTEYVWKNDNKLEYERHHEICLKQLSKEFLQWSQRKKSSDDVKNAAR
jgi:hypothetical protein